MDETPPTHPLYRPAPDSRVADGSLLEPAAGGGQIGDAAGPVSTPSLSYEPYYGLLGKPFSLSADPRFFYKSPSHARAFDELDAAIRRREGLIVLTGDIGAGKTTLCRAVLDQLDRQTFSTFVPDPFLSRDDLLKVMLIDFGVMSIDDLKSGRLRGASRADLSYPLYEFLDSLVPLQAFAVLVIDEAQNLPLPLLEEIRILSDLERRQKLLQVVLVGQPELRSHLRLPQMRQLGQRVSTRCELGRLDHDGVEAYVAHRLAVVGGSRDRIAFTQEALDRVWEASNGVPRVINLVCDRAMHHGWRQSQARIDLPLVERAVSDLDIARPPATSRGPSRSATVGASLPSSPVEAGPPRHAPPPLALAPVEIVNSKPAIDPAGSEPHVESQPAWNEEWTSLEELVLSEEALKDEARPEEEPRHSNQPQGLAAVEETLSEAALAALDDSTTVAERASSDERIPLETPAATGPAAPLEAPVSLEGDADRPVEKGPALPRRATSSRTGSRRTARVGLLESAAVYTPVEDQTSGGRADDRRAWTRLPLKRRLGQAVLVAGTLVVVGSVVVARVRYGLSFESLEWPDVWPRARTELVTPAPTPPVREPSVAAAAPANGPASLVIRTAMFSDRDAATRLVRELVEAGYPAYTSDQDMGSLGRFVQVLVGPYDAQRTAESDLARIRLIPGYGSAELTSEDAASPVPER